VIGWARCQWIQASHEMAEIPIPIDKGLHPGLALKLIYGDSLARCRSFRGGQLKTFKKEAPVL